MILCGGGVAISGAEAALAEFAETLGAPVATSVSGRGAIPDSHKLCLGVVGSNGGVSETRDVVVERPCICSFEVLNKYRAVRVI